jgi:pyruvate/2-oxoglutarate dehydrogenase complex dihydrolipoamide acyltransferase (E2) component
MDDLGQYKIKEFSKVRQLLSEAYEFTINIASVYGLIELDVDKARKELQIIQAQNGINLSFTGWLIKCIAQAVVEHKEVQAYRLKRDKIIVFDNVHVRALVERNTTSGKKVPVSHVIKYANTKSVLDITNEIREVQRKRVEEKNQFVEGTEGTYLKLFYLLPKFIRKTIIKKKASNPWFFIKGSGTVGITSVGMFSKNISGWALPFTASTLDIAVGGIKTKPVIIDGNLKEHEFLNLTLVFNHDIVDGAPATRFISRLSELIETGYGIEISNR